MFNVPLPYGLVLIFTRWGDKTRGKGESDANADQALPATQSSTGDRGLAGRFLESWAFQRLSYFLIPPSQQCSHCDGLDVTGSQVDQEGNIGKVTGVFTGV